MHPNTVDIINATLSILVNTAIVLYATVEFSKKDPIPDAAYAVLMNTASDMLPLIMSLLSSKSEALHNEFPRILLILGTIVMLKNHKKLSITQYQKDSHVLSTCENLLNTFATNTKVTSIIKEILVVLQDK